MNKIIKGNKVYENDVEFKGDVIFKKNMTVYGQMIVMKYKTRWQLFKLLFTRDFK